MGITLSYRGITVVNWQIAEVESEICCLETVMFVVQLKDLENMLHKFQGYWENQDW